MVQEGISHVPRRRHHRINRQKTFHNLRITFFCGIITILVLRGTIGFGTPGTTGFLDFRSERSRILEEAERVVAELRMDEPPDPDDRPANGTNLSKIFSFGPKIKFWDEDRRKWLIQHPEFPNYVNGKPRVMMVTGSIPKPCDNPIGDYYLLKSLKNKIDYCRIHDVEIWYNMAHLDKEMTGFWSKLPLIRRVMLSHPEMEWIWWIDSDAFFTDMVFDIPLSKYKNHNFVIHGYDDLLFKKRSWVALNTGSFLIRNCQWSLELLDAWAPMGPKGPIRERAGKMLTSKLTGRPKFEADDQSALVYLLIYQKEKWMSKVFIENSYYLHGYWEGLVDQYEEMMKNNHAGLGDDRWPFVTHFVGCKPCGSYGDYSTKRCLSSMERALNFADNQVLKLYGFRHRGLLSPNLKRVRKETTNPLDSVKHFGFRVEERKNGSAIEKKEEVWTSFDDVVQSQESKKRRSRERRKKTKTSS